MDPYKPPQCQIHQLNTDSKRKGKTSITSHSCRPLSSLKRIHVNSLTSHRNGQNEKERKQTSIIHNQYQEFARKLQMRRNYLNMALGRDDMVWDEYQRYYAHENGEMHDADVQRYSKEYNQRIGRDNGAIGYRQPSGYVSQSVDKENSQSGQSERIETPHKFVQDRGCQTVRVKKTGYIPPKRTKKRKITIEKQVEAIPNNQNRKITLPRPSSSKLVRPSSSKLLNKNVGSTQNKSLANPARSKSVDSKVIELPRKATEKKAIKKPKKEKPKKKKKKRKFSIPTVSMAKDIPVSGDKEAMRNKSKSTLPTKSKVLEENMKEIRQLARQRESLLTEKSLKKEKVDISGDDYSGQFSRPMSSVDDLVDSLFGDDEQLAELERTINENHKRLVENGILSESSSSFN